MSLTYSPSNQILLYNIDGTYKVIGTATNIIINTTRGKLPIFVFGKPEPQATIRGARFIEGSIDSVQFDKTFINELLNANKHRVSPIEYEILKDTYGVLDGEEQKKSVFGINDLVYQYEVDIQNIDDINLDELMLLSIHPQAQDGGKTKYLKIKLENVQFYDYSYAKSINDVTQLERVTFMATRLLPVTTEIE